jgi:hypothetical protein
MIDFLLALACKKSLLCLSLLGFLSRHDMDNRLGHIGNYRVDNSTQSPIWCDLDC